HPVVLGQSRVVRDHPFVGDLDRTAGGRTIVIDRDSRRRDGRLLLLRRRAGSGGESGSSTENELGGHRSNHEDLITTCERARKVRAVIVQDLNSSGNRRAALYVTVPASGGTGDVSGSIGVGRNQRAHWIGRSSRRHGQSGECRLDWKGI